LKYTLSDCFETYPLPVGLESNEALARAGQAYFEFRKDVMRRNDAGLTTVYNWFDDPNCDMPDVDRLRYLHAEVDSSVLDAYGWSDIRPSCEFVSEFDDEEDDEENGRSRKKKYRYRWPDDIRDDVLSRLLDLNRKRALEEGQLASDVLAQVNVKNERRKKQVLKNGDHSDAPLFAAHEGDA
jgi:hypothetical protein